MYDENLRFVEGEKIYRFGFRLCMSLISCVYVGIYTILSNVHQIGCKVY